jgi:transcription initiation factor IIE alpha subunit
MIVPLKFTASLQMCKALAKKIVQQCQKVINTVSSAVFFHIISETTPFSEKKIGY